MHNHSVLKSKSKVKCFKGHPKPMNILLKFCTLQIQFNLNKINHRNWNVWDLYFIVCCWQGVPGNRIRATTFENLTFRQKLGKYFYWHQSILFFKRSFGQIFLLRVSELCKKVKRQDKFGSLNFDSVFSGWHYKANWKPVYFTNFVA